MKNFTKSKLMLFSTLILIFAAALTSCEYEFVEVAEPTEPMSFAADILPIFSQNGCVTCHKTGGTSPDLTADKAYNAIYPALVNLTTPEQSIIYVKPAPSSSHAVKYTPAQASQVLAWIKEGALNN